MKHESKWVSREQENTDQRQEHQPALEFNEPEDLLRHDRAQTPPPPSIQKRLAESLAEQPPPRPWWKLWSKS